jgi:hypothetical protein
MLAYFTVNTVIESICLLTAVICLRKESDIIWRSQIFYLAATCITEFTGIYFKIQYHNNQWVYNIFILVIAGFTFLFFNHLIKAYTKNGKYWTIPGFAIFLVLYFFWIAKHTFYSYAYPPFIFISAAFVVLGLYYYYLLLNDEKYTDLKTSPGFWWVAGTLLFYFGNTACNIFDDELASVMIKQLNQHLTSVIYKTLNVILYSFWSYAFICKKWISISK